VAVPDREGLESYAIVTRGTDSLAMAVEGLGGSVAISDLTVVGMPSGNSPAFSVPDALTGKARAVEAIEGVLIHWQDTRAYWKDALDGSQGGSPPDCVSTDGETGHGAPGGSCALCPMAEFGSARNGAGQACSMRRNLFVVQEGKLLPLVLRASATSLAPVRRYFVALLEEGLPYWSVVTRFALDSASSKGGIKYQRLAPERVSTLSDEALTSVGKYREQIMPLLKSAASRAAGQRLGQGERAALRREDEEDVQEI
jgi:hypothetical protein